MIPPRSPLIGERYFPGMVTESGDLIVLAIQRGRHDVAPGEPLAAGDTLLLQGTWSALDQRINRAEVLVVELARAGAPAGRSDGPGRQDHDRHPAREWSCFWPPGLVPAAVAGLLAAGAVLLLGILNVDQVYSSINWTTVILVGAMMPLSTAITETGAADMLANGLISTVGQAGPRALIAGLFVLTAILGQVISNTATALIIIPISVVAATQMGVSPQPVLMAVGIAAAGAFLTPVATPTNLMVMEPAGYRFTDYWKFGLPMMIWFFIVAVFLVPLIWSFLTGSRPLVATMRESFGPTSGSVDHGHIAGMTLRHRSSACPEIKIGDTCKGHVRIGECRPCLRKSGSKDGRNTESCEVPARWFRNGSLIVIRR